MWRFETRFVTKDGAILIDWRKVGNFAGRLVGNRRVIAIADGNGTHAIAVPEGKHSGPLGDAGATVDGALGLMADDCPR